MIDPKKYPKWFEIANGEMGQHEIPGAEDNPRIVEYHQTTSLKANDDETPWCSAFVNWSMKGSGIKGTGLANARSWMDWGQKLEQPRPGCVVILKRGAPPSGHVGFYVETIGGRITVLGGNQSDRVKLSTFPISDVIGYRWPNDVK